MCSQSIEMPSPTVKYHKVSTPEQHINLPNMVEHRNNYSDVCNQQDNPRYDYDEIEDNSVSQHQYQQYYNPAVQSTQHPTLNETQQQQEDQHTIELRMNNLGNENIG